MEQWLWLGHASFLQGNDVPSILHRALPKQSSPDNNMSESLFKIIHPKEQLKLGKQWALSYFAFVFVINAEDSSTVEGLPGGGGGMFPCSLSNLQLLPCSSKIN